MKNWQLFVLWAADHRFQRGLAGAFLGCWCVAIALTGFPASLWASNFYYDPAGIYSATADDGTKVMLYRYRPAPSARYNTKGAPVLLFTGICENMNQYLSYTPANMKGFYKKVSMPSLADAPAWTKTPDGKDFEPYIKADKMRYYSLAHYLWLQGYDPWFTNYRDTGRDALRTKGATSCTLNTLDTWATLDVPAAIDKVIKITGKRIYIGGHSTGGFVSYAYLQGTYMSWGGYPALYKKWAYQMASSYGFQYHVKSDKLLAAMRNHFIKGVIGIDPAGRPPLPDILDLYLVWSVAGSRAMIPFDEISEYIVPLFSPPVVITLANLVFGAINTADSAFASLGVRDRDNLIRYMDFWYMVDSDPYTEDFLARYALSGTSMRTLAHYMDNGLNPAIREFYKNGYENRHVLRPPTPDPGNDGYYYYSENMDRMRVPLIVFSSTAGSMVSPQTTEDDIISKKTPSYDAYGRLLDEWYIIKGTAHMDLSIGKKTPTEIFPRIGAWLKRVEAENR